jgi:hypothetical protein
LYATSEGYAYVLKEFKRRLESFKIDNNVTGLAYLYEKNYTDRLIERDLGNLRENAIKLNETTKKSLGL